MVEVTVDDMRIKITDSDRLGDESVIYVPSVEDAERIAHELLWLAQLIRYHRTRTQKK